MEKNKVIFPDDMDPECLSICEAMNLLPGIRTMESCCGHGKTPFRVYFLVKTLEALPPVAYHLNFCHSGVPGWSVIARTDCSMRPISFLAEGPVGDFEGADEIAECIRDYVNQNADEAAE